MYVSMIILPLLCFLLATNRTVGTTWAKICSISGIITTCAMSYMICYEVGWSRSPVIVELGSWINSASIHTGWSFVFDSLTVTMLIPILTISVCVQVYSSAYMSSDPHVSRFFAYLSIFSFFMILLVTGENLVLLFLGWEGVGLASYLLINFWFTRIAANHAALKAFIMNRVGDWGLSLAIFLLLVMCQDVSFATLFSLGHYLDINILYISLLLLLIGAMAKSAQLGLHTWLPIAMEGPTPVSALIHAATMVTAGVYLLLRFSPLLEFCSPILLIITCLGSLTALLGALCGLLEHDLKRIIAYSTTSQLGYMVLACGLSQYTVSLFHLVNHAFFKALLFLSAGAVLHALADNQDIRKMGSLVLLTPFVYLSTFIGSLSLLALPFFTGFYSKDFLLELLLVPTNFTFSLASFFALLAAFITATYSCRLLLLTFFSLPRFPLSLVSSVHEPSLLMSLPLLFLFFASILFGWCAHVLFIYSDFFSLSLFSHPSGFVLFPFSSSLWQYAPSLTLLLLFSLLPLAVSYSSHSSLLILDTQLLSLFNTIYGWFIYGSFFSAWVLHRYVDRGLIELFGPYGLTRLAFFLSHRLLLFSSFHLLHYLSVFLFASVALFLCL